mgnify:CR=1 FL=1
MMIFKSKLKEYRELLSKDVDVALEKSVLIAILDPETKLYFVRQKVLSDHVSMRKELTSLFLHGFGSGAVPMDCNSVGIIDESPICQSCESQDPLTLNVIGKGKGKGTESNVGLATTWARRSILSQTLEARDSREVECQGQRQRQGLAEHKD